MRAINNLINNLLSVIYLTNKLRYEGYQYKLAKLLLFIPFISVIAQGTFLLAFCPKTFYPKSETICGCCA